MRIVSFTLENIKTLVGLNTFEPDGKSFFLFGSNGKGKTTAGAMLMHLLTRKFPNKIITEGKDEGKCEFTLDDGSILIGYFNPLHAPSLTFIDPSGKKFKSPKSIFDRLYGPGMTFDIDKFLALQPMPRRKMLEDILGVDMTNHNEDEKALIEDRKEINAKVRDQEARCEPYDRKLVELDDVNLTEVVARIETNEKRQLALSTQEILVDGSKASVKLFEDALKEYTVKLEDAQVKAAVDASRLSQIKNYLEDNDVEGKIKDDRELIDNATAIVQAKRLKIEHDKLKEYREEQETANEAVKTARNQKDAYLMSNPIPAEGLEWGEDGDLLFCGLPFDADQVATSSRVICGIQIASKMLGDINFIHFDGSILDKANSLAVMEWAEANDLQLGVEHASWGDTELTLEIFDKT